ncbi:Protocadherin-1 isoform 2 [Schistosoma japonicum]|uniref:Protocadherin-1 isoform 2 n=2 Tax=Schistosoma japonicum TaxID=6182 RepID=A0A4Z2D2V1_SCHJA|nr:Protocadherin-1 isoform 2 [Schistosoma japonicum]
MSTNLIKYDATNTAHQLINRPFIIYIREGDTSGFEGLPIASDADSEVNGIVMYKLTEQTSKGDPVKEPRLNISVTYGNEDSMSLHNLNPKLVLIRPLDYENVDDREIYATFYAIDGGDPSLTGSISIVVRLLDVNDNPPIFTQYTETERLITLSENTTMNFKPFFIVNASDADSGDNGRLTYSFSPLANSLISMKFNIDSRNGAVTIREPLDYEIYSERQFTLPIVVKDAGNPQHSSTTSLYIQVKDINDNIPTLVVQENISIPEGQVFTKPIIRFYVKDEDEVSHGNVVCKPVTLEAYHLQDKELVAGQDYLRLHAVSDTVFFVFTKGVLDYEKIPRASLLIECVDSAGVKQLEADNATEVKSHQIRITATIRDQNDNMPLFAQTKYYVKIPEHSSEGTLVTEIKAHDLDSGEYGQLTYYLGSVTTESGIVLMNPIHVDEKHLKQPFHINQTTGIIKVLHNNLLDREKTEFLYLPIIAKDKGGLTATTQLIIELIDINDNSPKLISSTNLKFEENQNINTLIDYIHLIDLDKDQNSRIHLKLINEHQQLNEMMKYIKIVPDLNFTYSKITFNELINNNELKALLISQLPIDRETISTIIYEIIAYDESIQSVHSVTYTISIQILDQNDNIPLCTYPIYDSIVGYHPMIHINTPMHSLVTKIRGYDPDQGLNGTIMYKLSKYTNGSAYFYLNESTGELFTNWLTNSYSSYHSNKYTNDIIHTSPINNEPIEGIYQLKIILTDMGIPPLSKETQFYVKINPLNPNLNKWNSRDFTMTTNYQLQNTVNKSINSNTNIKYWLSNNRIILIILIIFIIVIILIIIGTIFWIRMCRKQKLCHSIKTIIASSNETECNPIIISTTTPGKMKKNELINKENLLKSSVKQYQTSYSSNRNYEHVPRIANTNSSMITRSSGTLEQFEALNNFNSQWFPNTTNTTIQSKDANLKTFDSHNPYSPNFSLNDIISINTVITTTNSNNYINDPSTYANLLQTNSILTFPYSYEADSTNNNETNNEQLMGQKLFSVYNPEVYHSMCNSNLNIPNFTLSNSNTQKYAVYNNNNNNNSSQNNNTYLWSPNTETLKYSTVYSGLAYSHSSPVPNLGYNDQYQNQNGSMKLW